MKIMAARYLRTIVKLTAAFCGIFGLTLYFMRVKTVKNLLNTKLEHQTWTTNPEQEFLQLKTYIKNFQYLNSPPQIHTPKDKTFSQAGQDKLVFDLLPIKNGFFLEMGAYDGILYSNTLWLERNHNWTGILIEADPSLCKKIDKLQRSVWRLCACISDEKEVTFLPMETLGEVVSNRIVPLRNQDKTVTVPCFRLQTVMNYINRKRINYFSLDVEGGEMFVLNTIEKSLKSGDIVVDVWTIEYRVWDTKKQEVVVKKSLQNLNNLRNYFKNVGGYVEHSLLSNDKNTQDELALDVVFVKKEIWCKSNKGRGKC